MAIADIPDPAAYPSVNSSINSSESASKNTSVPDTLPSTSNAQPPNVQPGWNRDLAVDDVLYDLYLPASYRSSRHLAPCLLVLPGWNFPRTSWVENTNLTEYAERYGYVLVLPEMGKTLYESAYYAETELKWNRVPGGEFVKTRLIPELQRRHGLLQPGQHNLLLGLSTGGRGVALIALEHPGLFVAGASFSGDFSQENTPRDRLMTAVYGSFDRFRDRWLGADNPQARVAEWQMPLYLAHGIEDDVVPESQSRLFYQALKAHHGDRFTITYDAVPEAGHDYAFWGGQLEVAFVFLEGDR
ncbi:MAG: prolyl oligopeptidase family serine peptidase [Coleofasciculaceae cyanobacterium SM2_3_26]|nr:prolyl oligopeptidase family serine peptidase [Coleofasciculaceae cyanobacterium SM2_3_26]